MSKRISVIGTGYVGLVTGTGLADFGNRVTCVDVDKAKIDMLNHGQIPIYEPGLKELVDKNVREGRLSFTSEIDRAIKEAEVVFIGVGTPSKENGEADLSYVEAVVESIAKNLDGYKVIVTKSTVPVGTNRWIKQTIIEKSGKDTFDIVSNPEFLREGSAVHDVFHPDRVVIGYESERAKEIIQDIYKALYIIETPFLFCNLETAELVKYASNAFLATKITFINQIANLCEAVGADVHKVAKGMGMDGRISPKFLHPGPGYGGSCFPKDTKALVDIGNKYNVDMSLVKEVVSSNEKQKVRMVQKLETLFEGELKDKRIGILGLAFKAETDDMRESPSIIVIEELLKRGAKVVAHDPQSMENAKAIFGDSIEYADSEYKAMNNSDAIMILTEWNQYRSLDLEMAKKLMKGNIILDTRNLIERERARELGFICEGVGRK
ncbi:UDP-glucose 6-dehydrogenase [Mesotoga sp. HF07.pep.5.2.highcov]|uniref:UDP-glucose dehydrogenase family protein n=1 Tax=Mesotoga sp. HF07.pep.5.2.highcov TaxID=1462923 RepID=UPI000EF1573A|nr:UDP-glucose/GDP-mannose dehydrogenase family protein [Mesotoga sp. HF07.pep.5.2.highcov]RLL91191.1 UDP-glucose 6-dehydrogenase [Mesotoga sp. HF07.pep.5.2.highcov]